MTTRSHTVVVGWTKSDRAKGYSSYSDGYQPGAEQHTETFTVETEVTASGTHFMPDRIAEAVYEATNSPYVQPNDGSLAGQIKEALVASGYRGEGYHYSLSRGDTVTVDGLMLECATVGFTIVEQVSA